MCMKYFFFLLKIEFDGSIIRSINSRYMIVLLIRMKIASALVD